MKKLNKKWFAMLIPLLALITLSACATKKTSDSTSSLHLTQAKTLTIGLEGDYTPYSFRSKNGHLTGFEVELGRRLAKKLGLKPTFVLTKWDGLIAGLGTNKYDVVLNNIAKTPQRAKNFQTTVPYIYSHSILITRDTEKKMTSLKAIKGKKFAEGTGTDNELIAKKFGATVMPSPSFTTTLDLIKQGRADGAINSREAWLAYKQQNSTKGLKMKDVSDEQAPGEIVGLLNRRSNTLKGKLNRALKQLRQEGELKRLSVKYFHSDITK